MVQYIPGEALLELVSQADKELLLVAPYMKVAPLRKIIAAIPFSVEKCVCVTRWLPEDIATGVCDLEILDEIKQRPNAGLFVHHLLHAKYFANSTTALIGSANLTGSGLGWKKRPNLELMVRISRETPGLKEWEELLLGSAIPVTDQLRSEIAAQADLIRKETGASINPQIDVERDTKPWVPKCPVPSRLWDVYCGSASDTMVSSAHDAALDDLGILGIPPGLSRNVFLDYLIAAVGTMPIIRHVDRLATDGLDDKNAQEVLHDYLGTDADPRLVENSWRVIKEWLTYLRPTTYRLESVGQTLLRGRQLL